MTMPFLSKTTGHSSAGHTMATPKYSLVKRNRRDINRGRTAGLLHNQRGDITIYTCFFIVAAVMLVSFLLLYASIRITCINILGGAKMELNNLSASIYADTFRSQRETNFSEYLNTLYSSSEYVSMLEGVVKDGLANKLPLSTDDYTIRNIHLQFHVVDSRLEYVFSCDADFYIRMFGRQYPTVTRHIELTGFHNTKF